MSLIDEALKRARAQTDGQREPDARIPAAPKDPWAYAPLPEQRTRSRAAVTAAAIAAGVAFSLAVVLILARTHRSGPTRSPTSFAVAPVETARPASAGETRGPLEHEGSKVLSSVEVAPPPSYRAPVAPAAEELPDARARVRAPEPTVSRASPATAAGAASVSGMAGHPPAPVGSIGNASGSPRIASNGAPPEPPPPPSSAAAQAAPMSPSVAAASAAASHIPARNLIGSFVAPNGSKIELGGIVFSETSPVALINGRVLPVGGVTEGLTILTIEQNRIELEGENVHVFLSVK